MSQTKPSRSPRSSQGKCVRQQGTDRWHMYQGDCVDLVQSIPNDSVAYSIFSPPFASLFTYSDSERDMGNCRDDTEFFEHFRFLVTEMYRAHMPGRLVSIHCMNLPTTKQAHGVIGIRDFRGDIIRCMESAGWIYHSEVCVWKDPVTAMQRTKAIGLLHKQIVKDSAMSRQGIPDYVCTFRKPGDNPRPVAGELDTFVGDKDAFERKGKLSIDIWQRYASPVWMDINQSNTLNNYRDGREHDDERHICPLQLDVIYRCLQLWSLQGDLVLSPFAGIGSEGFCSVMYGRKFIGFEIKSSYFDIACKNLERAENDSTVRTLFHEAEQVEIKKFCEWGGMAVPVAGERFDD